MPPIENPSATEEVNRSPIENPPESEPESNENSAASPTQEQVQEMNDILKDVQSRLPQQQAAQGPNQEQVRDMIRKKTGMSDEGIDWVMQFNREVVTAAVGPIEEKLAFNELRAAKSSSSFPITADIEKGMRDELKGYPVQMRGDSVLLEKVYLMTIGKQQISSPKAAPSQNHNTNPVVGRRIVSNNPAPAGNGGGAAPADSKGQLTADEKVVARKMGVSEVDYLKWKGNPVIQR